VSTPIRDVVRHYGHLEGVGIAGAADNFVAECEKALKLARTPHGEWLAEADLMLATQSWDTTQARMEALIEEVLGERVPESRPAMLVAAE
jgi:UDP-galactopyranose mutase